MPTRYIRSKFEKLDTRETYCILSGLNAAGEGTPLQRVILENRGDSRPKFCCFVASMARQVPTKGLLVLGDKSMSLRLLIAVILSILAIGLLIIDQDQFAMFFGTRTAVVSIVFVSGCGALTALSVDSDEANLFAKRVEAFARGSILSAVVAVLVSLTAMLANIADFAAVGPALGASLLCPMWAAVFKFFCNLLLEAKP